MCLCLLFASRFRCFCLRAVSCSLNILSLLLAAPQPSVAQKVVSSDPSRWSSKPSATPVHATSSSSSTTGESSLNVQPFCQRRRLPRVVLRRAAPHGGAVAFDRYLGRVVVSVHEQERRGAEDGDDEVDSSSSSSSSGRNGTGRRMAGPGAGAGSGAGGKANKRARDSRFEIDCACRSILTAIAGFG